MSTYLSYQVEDINQTIRRTNTLLRAANAVRLSIRDIKQVWKAPTSANIMWTLVQFSRTYSSLKRLMRLVAAETEAAGSLMGLMKRIVVPPDVPIGVEPPMLDFDALSVRVDAFRDNIPMGLEGIDLSDLPAETREVVQALLEEDAEITVNDAKTILHNRILHPEESTGWLESSTHWEPQVDGVRIVADAYYAWWVERGHRVGGGYFPGHWYMTDATERMKQRLPYKIWVQLNQLIS